MESGSVSDPKDPVAMFDFLTRAAAVRGFPGTFHVHPSKFEALLHAQVLTMSAGGETRLSAIRAVTRLKRDVDTDAHAFLRTDVNLATGSYRLGYFTANGDMREEHSGWITIHNMHIARRDVERAIGTGFDLLMLEMTARMLRDAGKQDEAAALDRFHTVRQPEAPEVFKRHAWPKLASLLEEHSVFRVGEHLSFEPGCWIAIARVMEDAWSVDLLRYSREQQFGPDRFVYALEGSKTFKIMPVAHGLSIESDPDSFGANIPPDEPVKVVVVPDALAEEIGSFVPPRFEESFTLDL